jgi:hypothetical protein
MRTWAGREAPCRGQMLSARTFTSGTWGIIPTAFLALCAFYRGPVTAAQDPATKHLTARGFDSGFELSNGTFNGMLAASDGKIYYVLCSSDIDTGAQMYSFDPATDKIEHLGDLTEASGEKGLKSIPQGQSHVNFVESDGKLYFSTHVDWYTAQGGLELMAPPFGYKPYPGGHFLAYDMASGKFENLVKAPSGQGIIAMNMDIKRRQLYGLLWPSGHFLRYDLRSRDLREISPLHRKGESDHRTLEVLCRALPIDPADGSVYFSNADGDLMRYRFDRDAIEMVQGDNLRKDYFGSWNPLDGQNMGYGWRQAVWYAPENAIYAIHGRSAYLFRFDPRAERVDVLRRIASEPSMRSGSYDDFRFGYLSFTLGPDGHTLFYLTEGRIVEDGKRAVVYARPPGQPGAREQPIEDLHLITYDISAAKYTDHGAVFFSDGGRPGLVNSIAVGKDGSVYCITDIPGNGRRHIDLVRIPRVQ